MSNVFSRILVGIDGSETSQDAAALGARLAREHGGQLILCHAVNWLPVITQVAAAGGGVDTVPLIDNLNREGATVLDRAEQTAKRTGVAAQRRALEGEPAESILELARASACSLIVLGTHGRQGFERLFVGSTAEAVLRGSTVPVLTVRSGVKCAGESRRCFENIVVGIDDSEPSGAAIEAVFDLPAEDRQQLAFYSVALGADIFTGLADTYAANLELRQQAQRVVDRALASARARGVTAEGRVVDGRPAELLIAAAQERQADLIVLGSHGRRGLERFFLGSVAEGVVRTAPVPVLVVRTAA
jgi:nucleotide-binding universal stress UspA family protein